MRTHSVFLVNQRRLRGNALETSGCRFVKGVTTTSFSRLRSKINKRVGRLSILFANSIIIDCLLAADRRPVSTRVLIAVVAFRHLTILGVRQNSYRTTRGHSSYVVLEAKERKRIMCVRLQVFHIMKSFAAIDYERENSERSKLDAIFASSSTHVTR